MSKALLITGATGKQGGATIRALLASPQAADFTIIAVTRNPESASAKRLADKGVKLVQGDLNDTPAVFAAAKALLGPKQGIWGVFSVQIPMGRGASPETEVAQGKALVDEALAAGVKFFVYTSVDRGGNAKSFETPTEIPHFVSKHHIEHHLVDKAGDKMQWLIIRPVAFMENFTKDMQGKVTASMFKVTQGDKPFQLISIKDIGGLAAKGFINPDQFAGKSLGIAGDELSFAQLNEVFKKTVGTDMPITYDFVGRGLAWAVKEVSAMTKWFVTDGYGVDLQEVKGVLPEVLTWQAWLEQESNWAKKD